MLNDTDTRLFWVVDSDESYEELFETFQQAAEYMTTLPSKDSPRLRICIVRHAYREDSGEWNYDDLPDTFESVKEELIK